MSKVLSYVLALALSIAALPAFSQTASTAPVQKPVLVAAASDDACSQCMTNTGKRCDTDITSCEMGCKTNPGESSSSYGQCRQRCADQYKTCKAGLRGQCAGICK